MLSPGRGLFRIERFGFLCYYFIYTHCPDLIATCSLTCAEINCAAEVIQKIPMSSSGSAAVTERNLLRTSYFFGPLYNCFLGLVRGYIITQFLPETSCFSSFQFLPFLPFLRFSLCGNHGAFSLLSSLCAFLACLLSCLLFFLSCPVLSFLLSCLVNFRY